MSEQEPTWAKAYKLADDWLMDDEAPFTQELGIELAETIIDLCGRIDLLEQERDALKAQIAAVEHRT